MNGNPLPAGRKGEVISLQMLNLDDDGFHPLVEVVVFGQPFTAVLDTGASKTAFDRDLLLQANQHANLLTTDRLSTGLGTNSMVSHRLLLHDMFIGTFCIAQTEVAVLDLSAINHAYSQLNQPAVLGVIGSDLLMRYAALVNYDNTTLTLFA